MIYFKKGVGLSTLKPAGKKQGGGKKCGAFVVNNDKGLHTRPSTELVKCASHFKADIHLFFQDDMVNAKSLLGILMMAACKGTKVRIEAKGADAAKAVKAIERLANNGFNMEY